MRSLRRGEGSPNLRRTLQPAEYSMDGRHSAQEVDTNQTVAKPDESNPKAKHRVRSRKTEGSSADEGVKRRCVSTACIACRRRKSKCDGNLPACAACSSVYNTECIYDPNSDHRRKGVYKKDIDKLKTRNSTLEVLIQALLNVAEDEVPALVHQIRTCESLDSVADSLLSKEAGIQDEDQDLTVQATSVATPTFETQLSGQMGELRLEDGSTRYIGGTSNLLFLGSMGDNEAFMTDTETTERYPRQADAVVSWTNVTDDPSLVMHLVNMYFTWHYTYFTTLSKSLFWKEFLRGRQPSEVRHERVYCTPLLVNAMLALGCHFTAWPGARANPDDSATAGDHFFNEAKRLIMENDEHERPRLTTVQALALMSVREAGCGREAKGWVYSGMSFRMACDLGLHLNSGTLSGSRDASLNDEEIDARRITFWGCFLFDKCWSNYLGRLPQLTSTIITTPKFDVFPGEESEIWSAYTDSGFNQSHAQPTRTRAVALQISALCEISSDLMNYFYNPIDMDKTKGRQAELKKLSDIHQRLEAWRRKIPPEMEPREGGLPSVLVMHMFFQLLYIHTFRPFLKYSQKTSPLPPNVSPRRLCTQAAASISKLLRLYKRSYGLRHICNIAVYIVHSACTIHLLNLPDKNAKRDITHGVKNLEEIAEFWLCARRTLTILSMLSRKWNVKLPEEAADVLARTDEKFGPWNGETQVKSSPSEKAASASPKQTSGTPLQRIINMAPPATQSTSQQLDPSVVATSSGSDILRRINCTTSLRPQSATELHQRSSRLPSHSNTPQQSAVNSPKTGPSYGSHVTKPTGDSPSAIFGGVEQLLREGQDWWLRDQSQLAVEFDQWPVNFGAEAGDAWMGISTSGASPQAVNGGGFGVTGHGLDGVNGFGQFGGLGEYSNEHEWYL